MKKEWVLLASILLLVIAGLIVLWAYLFAPLDKKIDSGPTQNNHFLPQNTSTKDISPNSNTPIDSNSDSGSSASGGSSGSSGGSSGSSSSSNQNTSCQSSRIAYSLKNFEKYNACTQTVNNLCTSIYANCSIDVYHLDAGNMGGIFEITYDLINSSGETLDSAVVSNYVTYNSFKTFATEFTYSNSAGVDENSLCDFTLTQVPQKETC